MDIQRLRNLTTGRLHTEMAHIYEDIEHLVGVKGVMTHQLGKAASALEPYLRDVTDDLRLWDGKFDPTHIGEIEVSPMDDDAQAAFWMRYEEAGDPI